MSLGHDSSGLMQGSYSYVRAHIDAISGIVPPGQRWRARDASEEAQNHLMKLLADGAIERVGRTHDGFNIYETREETWEIIQQCLEHRETLLCDHGGLKNLGDGLYECGEPNCDHRYTRDTIKVLLDDS